MSEKKCDCSGVFALLFFAALVVGPSTCAVPSKLKALDARLDALEATHGQLQEGGYIPDTERPCYPFCPEEPAP